jgi:WXG100 family type VII secretion target
MSNFMTDPDAMRASAKKFHQHTDNITADAGKAWTASNDISGSGWGGDANAASLSSVEEMMRAFKNIEHMLTDTSTKLTVAADNYEQQEAANRSSLST